MNTKSLFDTSADVDIQGLRAPDLHHTEWLDQFAEERRW